MIGSKVSPKLSSSQTELLTQLVKGLHDEDTAARLARRQARGNAHPVVSSPTADSFFRVGGPVRLLRDVVGTAYRAGQQGTILALHNLPAKSASSAKAAKVVAEVLINETLYADTVGLQELEKLA